MKVCLFIHMFNSKVFAKENVPKLFFLSKNVSILRDKGLFYWIEMQKF